jgi:hypothetical protein
MSLFVVYEYEARQSRIWHERSGVVNVVLDCGAPCFAHDVEVLRERIKQHHEKKDPDREITSIVILNWKELKGI